MIDIGQVMAEEATQGTAKICLAAFSRAREQLSPENLMAYLNFRFKAIFEDNNYDVEFIGVERLTYRESLGFIEARKETYDITKSSMFYARFKFKVSGRDFHRITALPYIEGRNEIFISGMPYTMVEVISDKLISPGMSGVFVRFLKNKINISSMIYDIRVDGRIRAVTVPRSEPLNPRTATIPPAVPILWYLLVKYGFADTMKSLHPELDVQAINESDITLYTKKGYTIVSTTYDGVMRPQDGIRFDKQQKRWVLRYKYLHGKPKENRPKVISIAFKGKPKDNLIYQTAASLLYVIDLMPDFDKRHLYDLVYIKYIMALIVFKVPGDDCAASTLRSKLEDKLATLDGHVDKYMQYLLQEEFGDTLEEDFSTDGFYKIIRAVYKRYTVWQVSARWIAANIFDKKFKMLDYITVPLFNRINTLHFGLSQYTANKGEKPDTNAVTAAFTKDFTAAVLFAIRKDTVGCTKIAYGGDNVYVKGTSTLHLQFNVPSSTGNRSESHGKKSNGAARDPITLIHETHSLCGTAVAGSRNRDTTLKYLNLFAPLDRSSMTLLPSKEQLDRTTKLESILRNMHGRSREIEVPQEFARRKTR